MSYLIMGIPAEEYWPAAAKHARRVMSYYDEKPGWQRRIDRTGVNCCGEPDPHYRDHPLPTRPRNRHRPLVRVLTH
jgi:hypothetical protein